MKKFAAIIDIVLGLDLTILPGLFCYDESAFILEQCVIIIFLISYNVSNVTFA